MKQEPPARVAARAVARGRGWTLCALAGLVALLAAAPGCTCGDGAAPAEQYDASRQRRVFKPPPGEVRAVPPHAIHAGGVGPYLLGMPLKEALELLPHGPRVVLLQIDGVLDYSLVRAESDGLLIGVEPPRGVMFLSVLEPELARTESGVGVGTRREALSALGRPHAAPDWAADPRLMRFETLPDARFVIEDGAVSAVLVQRADRFTPPRLQPRVSPPPDADGPPPPRAPAPARPSEASPASGCAAPALADADADAEVIAAARLDGDAAAARVAVACVPGAPADAVVYTDERVVAVTGEPGKWRRGGSMVIPGIVYAAPIDLERDGRLELAVVTQSGSDGFRTVRLELLRSDQGRLQRIGDDGHALYRVSEGNVTGTGARMAEIDLLIELHAHADGVWVSGVYLQRGRGGPRTVAPLLPTAVPVRRRRASAAAPPAPAAAIAPDAGAEPSGLPAEPKPVPDAGD